MSDTADTPRPNDNQVPALPATSGTPALAPEEGRLNTGETVRTSWRYSLDNINAAIGHNTEEAQELLRWAFLWCIDPEHPVHFKDFCSRMQVDATTVSRVYEGKYRNPKSDDPAKSLAPLRAPKALVDSIRIFRRSELLRVKAEAAEFLKTPTAKKVYWAIAQAREGRRPVMLFGGSHIGKTEACKANSRDFNHGRTVVIELEAVNGLRGLVQATAKRLGISDNSNTPDLTERIKAAVMGDMVLIYDEVHLLANVYRKGSFFACMEWIRRLWDATKCGMVLTYTELGYEKACAERKRELLQVFRRCVFKVNLGASPRMEDVKVFVAHAGLSWEDRRESVEVAKGVSDTPLAALRMLAENEGLAAIIERFRLGYSLAAADGRQQLTWTDWMRAHFAILKAPEAPKSDWED